MLISFYQKLYTNFVALIAITFVIGNQWLCVQGSLDDTFVDYGSELNDVDSNQELFDYLDAAAGKSGMLPRYLNVSKHPGELCKRKCVKNQRRVCHFELTLEHYQAMGVACGRCAQGVKEDCNHPQCIVGDGVEKGVMSINRQIPGPAIHVCKGDVLVMDVHNNAQGTTAAMHWHGLHMVDTPHMDGVPFVTQCPIQFATSFRYLFYATQAGTQFYHGHSGHHKANGHYGALIVRTPKESSSAYVCDLYEHYILISDWSHEYAEDDYPGRPGSSIGPKSVLINGRGVFTNPITRERTNTPPTVYIVNPGKYYRFRVINSVSHTCHYQLQIQGHSFIMKSTDSHDVLPREFDTLVSNAGERYDFLLKTNHTEGDFWMRVRGLGACARNPVESYALIRYGTNATCNGQNTLPIPPFPRYEEQYPFGRIINHPNATCYADGNNQCVSELRSSENNIKLHKAKPDRTIYLSFRNHLVPNSEIFKPNRYLQFINPGSNLTFMGAINNISMIFTPFPLLTQSELIDESKFCDGIRRPEKCTNQQPCPCTHVIKVKTNTILDIMVVDETTNPGQIHHPFHLHGYRFQVIRMGKSPDGRPMTIALAQQMQQNNTLSTNYKNLIPPMKDTISVPSTGFAHVRINASNLGYWIMHCHYDWHLSVGMSVVLQVGEPSEMVKPPKGFPKCNNYMPPVKTMHY